MDFSDLLELSVQTQAVLASGYAAQMVAFRGLRSDCSAADLVFGTLVFGLPCLGVLAIGNELNSSEWISIPAGFVVACVAAAVWRIWIRKFIAWGVRQSGITWSSDHRSGWAWVVDCDGINVSEVYVEHIDGSYYFFNGDEFADKKLVRPPVHLGHDGGIALRVTHAKYAGDEEWTEAGEVNTECGDLLTYFPPQSISCVQIRYQK